jgi:hypothetical protein
MTSQLKVDRISPATGSEIIIDGFDAPAKSILQQKYISTTVDEVATGPAYIATSLRIDITPTDETSKMFISLSAGFNGVDSEAGTVSVIIARSFDDFANQEILHNGIGTGRAANQHGAFAIDDGYLIENGSLQPMSYLIKHLANNSIGGKSQMLAGATLLVWEISQ